MKKQPVEVSKKVTRRFQGGTVYGIIIFTALILVGGSSVALNNYIQTNTSHLEPTTKLDSDTGQTTLETDKNIGKNMDETSKTIENDNKSTPKSITRQPPAASPSKSGCNWYSDVPFNTVNKPDSNMHEGQTRSIGGVNGSRKVCTNSQGTVISDDISYPPVDRIVYYGTYTYEQALNDANYACRGVLPDSSYHGDCVSSEMRKRGF